MKKIVLIASLFLIPTMALSCQIIFINDGKTPVSVKDLNAPKKPFRLVEKDTKIMANVDPNTHARLLIKIGPSFYLVKQHACSKNHKIPLKASDVIKGNGGKLLEINKGKV